MHSHFPSTEIPLGEDTRTETASIQNFKSNATNEQLKARSIMQIP